MNIEREFFNFCNSFLDKSKKYDVAIGFSGGADSTALLVLLNNYQKKWNIFSKITPVFFKHGDNELGKDDENILTHCLNFTKNLNLSLEVIDLNLVKTKKGLESEGHNARVAYYNQSNFDFVFLGHHLDDQCETVMLQLFRGAGKSMAGMQGIDKKFVRPLININKKDILDYLSYFKIDWLDDPLNKNNAYSRNLWRNDIFPKLEVHYKDYKKKLQLFSEKINTKNNLLKDLAYIDNLQDIIDNKAITYQLHKMSQERLINLVEHYFFYHNKSIQKNQIKEFVKFLKNDNPYFVFSDDNEILIFSKKTQSIFNQNAGYNMLEQYFWKNEFNLIAEQLKALNKFYDINHLYSYNQTLLVKSLLNQKYDIAKKLLDVPNVHFDFDYRDSKGRDLLFYVNASKNETLITKVEKIIIENQRKELELNIIEKSENKQLIKEKRIKL